MNALFSIFVGEMPELKLRFAHAPFCNFPESFGKGFGQIKMVRDLLKVKFKTITLKKGFVVGRIVVHPESRVGKPFDKQTPVHVIFTKIDRAVHGHHAPCSEPIAGLVKKHDGRFLVVDAFKEAHPAGRLLEGEGLPAVDKCSNTANYISFVIQQDPPGSFAMLKKAVLGRIKHVFDFRVQSPDIIWISLIYGVNHI